MLFAASSGYQGIRETYFIWRTISYSLLQMHPEKHRTASWNECPILGKSVHLSKSLESVINLFMNFAATNFLENVIRFCNYDVFKLMVIVQ